MNTVFAVKCFYSDLDCHSLLKQTVYPRHIDGDRSVSLLVKRATYITVQLLSSIAVARGTVLQLLWPQLFVANYSRLCFEEFAMRYVTAFYSLLEQNKNRL